MVQGAWSGFEVGVVRLSSCLVLCFRAKYQSGTIPCSAPCDWTTATSMVVLVFVSVRSLAPPVHSLAVELSRLCVEISTLSVHVSTVATRVSVTGDAHGGSQIDMHESAHDF
jgi:hypothetical protein